MRTSSLGSVTILLACVPVCAGEWPTTHYPTRTAGPQFPLVHVVLVADTDAKDLGPFFRLDCDYMTSQLVTPIWLHYRLARFHRLEGRDATPESVIRTIGSLPVRPCDTVLFYYAGHGGIKWPTQDHQLTMVHGELSRRRLLHEIALKRPNLGIVLTDCCSSLYAGISDAYTKARWPAQASRATPSWGTIQQLFFDLNGLVDVTAARPGSYTWTYRPTGSAFTVAFCSALSDSQAITTGQRLATSVVELSREG